MTQVLASQAHTKFCHLLISQSRFESYNFLLFVIEMS